MNKVKVEISLEEARSFLVNYHNLNEVREYRGIDGIIQCFQQLKSIPVSYTHLYQIHRSIYVGGTVNHIA